MTLLIFFIAFGCVALGSACVGSLLMTWAIRKGFVS